MASISMQMLTEAVVHLAPYNPGTFDEAFVSDPCYLRAELSNVGEVGPWRRP